MQTKREQQRLAALFPQGQPRYVRAYRRDTISLGLDKARPFLVVFSGNYRGRGAATGAERIPFHHATASQSGLEYTLHKSDRPVDANDSGFTQQVGRIVTIEGHKYKRIRFEVLPREVQMRVIEDYIEFWGLPHDAAFREFNRPRERQVEIIEGESGPATIPESFMAPGRPEFDRQSQFVKVYKADSEVGPGATEEFFDQYAWVQCGEVCRIYTGKGHWSEYAHLIVEKLREGRTGPDILRTLRDYMRPGTVVNWDKVGEMARNEAAPLAIAGLLGRSSTQGAIDEVLFRMEAEAQNDFHGFEGPLPYPTVHIVAHKVDGSVPTSYCGLPMHGNSAGELPGQPVVEESKQPLWILRERFERFGPPPFSPICLDCADGLAHTKAAEDKGKLVVVSGGQMAELLKREGFVPVADPSGAILGIEPADATPLEKAQADYELAVNNHQGRKLFFLGIAALGSVPLGEKDANEWAVAMAQAELLREHASGGPGQFEVVYDHLLGVVTVTNEQTGRFAALESELCDKWARWIRGEERERVLLALVFDKYLNNPDVEGLATALGGDVPEAQADSILGEQFRPTSVEEAESFFLGVAQADIFLIFASYHWYSNGIGAEEWVTRMATAEALASISTGFTWHEEWNAPTGQREALVEVRDVNGRRASFWVASQEVRWWEAQREAGSRVFRAILFDKYLHNPGPDSGPSEDGPGSGPPTGYTDEF